MEMAGYAACFNEWSCLFCCVACLSTFKINDYGARNYCLRYIIYCRRIFDQKVLLEIQKEKGLRGWKLWMFLEEGTKVLMF